MLEVSVKQLRAELRQVIDRVEAGEEATITRRGKTVARLLPPEHTPKEFPDLTEFRASIEIKGPGVSETLIAERRETRY